MDYVQEDIVVGDLERRLMVICKQMSKCMLF